MKKKIYGKYKKVQIRRNENELSGTSGRAERNDDCEPETFSHECRGRSEYAEGAGVCHGQAERVWTGAEGVRTWRYCDSGTWGKVLLLRADMDALPMPEKSGLDFACPTGTEAHACGHDFHAAMLLTTAKMLKENEDALEGTVKFMFQPAEETFEGSKDMVAAGILENPAVDAALAFHVTPGKMPVGLYMYNNKSTMMFSVYGFKITVKEKASMARTRTRRSIRSISESIFTLHCRS